MSSSSESGSVLSFRSDFDEQDDNIADGVSYPQTHLFVIFALYHTNLVSEISRCSEWFQSIQEGNIDLFSEIQEEYRHSDPRQIGTTAQKGLNLAAEFGRLGMMKRLLSEPFFGLIENNSHHAAMFSAFKAENDSENDSSIKVIGLLRDYGSSFQARNRQQETVLHVAARKGYFFALDRLLQPEDLAELRNIVDWRDGEGQTALHVAAQYGKSDIAGLLILKYDADIAALTLGSHNKTALHLAATVEVLQSSRNAEFCDTVALLLHHSDLRRNIDTDTEGWRALHWLTWYEEWDLIRCLVFSGANLEVKDSCGRRPVDITLHIAKRKPARAVVAEMVELLSPANSEWRSEPPGPVLMRPTPKDQVGILDLRVHLLDMSRKGWIETSAFSVRSVLYKYGPIPIMKAMERGEWRRRQGRRREGLMRSDDINYILSWIHLPENNVSSFLPSFIGHRI